MLPVPLKLKQPKSISCQSNYTAVVMEDGSVYGYGENKRGRMGSLPERPQIPSKISELINIDKVSCGIWHMLALSKEGVCVSAGSNKNGELGHN